MLLTTILLSSMLGDPVLKREHLTVTQGYIESNMNSKAVGKSGEKGAWQVREKYWGKVPKDLYGQALQSERILDELLKNCGNDLHTALRKYNGAGLQAVLYADKVIGRTFQRVLLGT